VPAAIWLFLRCVLWGVATGAAVGGSTGALLGAAIDRSYGGVDFITDLASAEFVLIATLLGVVYGAVLAVVPAAVGGLAVTEVTRRRHPQPASPEAVRRDLGLMFVAVAILVNAAFFPALFVTADENAPTGEYLVALLAGNLSGGPVLWWARSSITKAWAGASR
jgi:hypothetical protein